MGCKRCNNTGRYPLPSSIYLDRAAPVCYDCHGSGDINNPGDGVINPGRQTTNPNQQKEVPVTQTQKNMPILPKSLDDALVSVREHIKAAKVAKARHEKAEMDFDKAKAEFEEQVANHKDMQLLEQMFKGVKKVMKAKKYDIFLDSSRAAFIEMHNTMKAAVWKDLVSVLGCGLEETRQEMTKCLMEYNQIKQRAVKAVEEFSKRSGRRIQTVKEKDKGIEGASFIITLIDLPNTKMRKFKLDNVIEDTPENIQQQISEWKYTLFVASDTEDMKIGDKPMFLDITG